MFRAISPEPPPGQEDRISPFNGNGMRNRFPIRVLSRCTSPTSPVSRYSNSILYDMAKVWREDRSPDKRVYKEKLHIHLQHEGLNFINNLAVLGMRATLENALPSDNNFVLMRLMYLAGYLGILSRQRAFNRETNRPFPYKSFPFHVACAFTHGKRIQINTDNFAALDQWLFRGLEHRLFKRFSSHALIQENGKFTELLGLRQILRGRDRGLNLAILGNRRISPFTGQVTSEEQGISGHLCIVSEQNNQSAGGAFLLGVENAAPGRKAKDHSWHGPLCIPDDWSAFCLPKWGDDEFFGAYNDSKLALHDASPNTLLIDATGSNLVSLLTQDDESIQQYVMNLLSDDHIFGYMEAWA